MVLIPPLEFQTDWLLQRREEPARGSTFPNPKRRIKTILSQFRNNHARYLIKNPWNIPIVAIITDS
jgi:hypothetical protein